MSNSWITHVKKYSIEHNVSYKDALKLSKSTYKKTTSGGTLAGYDTKFYALLSSEAYNKPHQRKDVQDFKYKHDQSNIDVAVYVNEPKKILVFAYKGTNSIDNVKTDMSIAFKGFENTAHFKRALAHMHRYIPMYKGFKIILTGHSLGGHTADIIEPFCDKFSSSDCGYEIFNRGTGWIEKFGDKPLDNTKIHHHIKGDLLSNSFLKNKSVVHNVSRGKTGVPHLLSNFT